ncbi:hypothetical protein [Limosilactobacillus caccae]|uniref:hypothetical protein n=1 Tax=Limosilactobacillus caccae TaxID=1926284 RepID=UPI000970E7AC|nr:hypothetical protein [Limosilactobacillus caccae]
MKKRWLLVLLTAVLVVAMPLQVLAKPTTIKFDGYRISYKIVRDKRAIHTAYSDDDKDGNKVNNAGYLILDVEQAADEYSAGDELNDYGFSVYDGEVEVSHLDKDDFRKSIIKKYHPTLKMPKLHKGIYSKARLMYQISPSDKITIKPREGDEVVIQEAQSSDGIFTDEPVVAKEDLDE